MFEAIYVSFGSNGWITARSVLYIFLVALILGFFGVFIVRAIKERFSSNKKSREKPESEHTTEIVTVDLD